MRALGWAGAAFRSGASGVWTLLLWTSWLALGLLLAAQIYVASTSELAVPNVVLRRLERAIADAGIRATFGKSSFDPTGRLLLENVQLALPEYPEPVVTVRSVYVQLNPWMLAVGRFEPQAISITGADAQVPAMLSQTGRPEELIHELDTTLVPAGRQMGVTQLRARIAGIDVIARGAFALTGFDPKRPQAPLAEVISTQFPRWCRQAMAVREQLTALDQPALELELAPSETRAALVTATLHARNLVLNSPLTAQVRGLRLITRVPLFGDADAASELDLTADEVRLPLAATARGFAAQLTGRFRPGSFEFVPDELRMTAATIAGAGITAEAASAQLWPQPLPRLRAEFAARVMGAPLAMAADADFAQRTATLQFAGSVAPAILTPVSERLGADIRRFFDFTTLAADHGRVQLGPGWKFEKLNAHVSVRGIKAHRVAMEAGWAEVEVEPGRVFAPRAYARIGENFAHGSYEQDLRTRAFRFLLDGQLRPDDISGWFREWWPRFFQRFDFSAAAPRASVDVSGVWKEGRQTAVFVFADVAKPVVQGAAFDRVRTRLFIRPGYFDGLEILATQGPRRAEGTFTYFAAPGSAGLQRLDLNLVSTVDLETASRIVGPIGDKVFSQFVLAQPPEVKLTARFDGAASPTGAHQTIDLAGVTRGGLRFNGFPLGDATFTARVRDDEILVENLEAGFAGGTASGRAKIWGVGGQRRVGFDLTLKNASLGQATAVVQRFNADRKKLPAPVLGKFVQEKANVRMDVAASAEGRLDDFYSYQGEGNAVLQGELGEVPLLGLLSELLKFTALRFTTARANFKIDSTRLAFSEVAIGGANSRIDAKGDYRLDRNELDFKAKLFPFQESENILKSVVGAVLSPISNVFEVKLSGTLEKPEWAFVIGPTNLLRNLATGPAAADSSAGVAPGPGAPGDTPLPTPPTASPPPDQPRPDQIDQKSLPPTSPPGSGSGGT